MKNYSILTALVVAIVLGSCSRQEESSQQRTLSVDVQMESSTWLTRAEDNNTGIRNVVALDDQLEIVTEAAQFDEVPITRGTPVANAVSLPSMGIGVYTNSTFARTVTGTNSGGSWSLSNNMTIDGDKNSYSYYAYSPAADAATNGVTVASDGKSLAYAAPADITKQPDLCWAAPITGDKTGTPTFAMKHAMTAVGLKVRADNVEIQSVTLTQIQSSGTLSLTNGAWSSLGTLKDFALPLITSKPVTGNNVADLTTADGFLMIPAQDITADAKKLVIVYRYTGEGVWRTGTHTIKSLGGATPWTAGQKVIYTIQLKAKFSLDLAKTSDAVSPSAGNYTLNYTTGSLASTTLDPQVTSPEASGGWITNLKVNRGNGSGTITFSYPVNSASASRKTLFTVTSGFTTKTFEFTQLPDYWVTLSATAPSGDVPKAGGKYTITVTTPPGVAWKTVSPTNCTVSPSSGSVSASVTITVPATTVERNVSVTFSTNVGGGITEKTAVWSGKQTIAPPDCWPTHVADYPNTFVALLDNGRVNYSTATNKCAAWGGRLPTLSELAKIMPSRASYGKFSDDYWYWSSTPYLSDGRHQAVKTSGNIAHGIPEDNCYVRCVKDA